ncbi:MAG: anti-sigma factor antagonist [Proteobacteria bacterium]|nr:MAG: anti-sigma factor antagonist [Pseudomonadota bacterium]
MKIQLSYDGAAAILGVTGEIDMHNFEVLKAGISKLFRSGKNRIILNLEDATEISGEALRELAILDVFARELSGKIVLSATNPELKESVRLFSKPPVIPIVSTVAQGLEVFSRLSDAEHADPETLGAWMKRAETAEAALNGAQEELARLNPKALADLQAEAALLRTKISVLESQVEALTFETRQPVSAEGFLEKISALEESVKRLGAGATPA